MNDSRNEIIFSELHSKLYAQYQYQTYQTFDVKKQKK
jgi:hypothetical protein